MNKSIQSTRTYDFNVLKKTLPIQDVSEISSFKMPEEELPKILDQKTYQCCVACVISEILFCMSKKETEETEQYSISYIYGKHRQDNDKSTGMLVENALKSLLEYGSIPLEILPQLVEMPKAKEIVDSHPEWDEFAKNSKISSYCQIRWSNQQNKFENIKLALVNYKMPLLAVSNKGFGSPHCILIYGFEVKNNEPYVLIQNSWGKQYGNGGRVSVALSKIDYVYVLFDDIVHLPFTDVSDNEWYYKPIRNMYLQGYVDGKTDTEFYPNDNMTRAEVCTLLNRILKRQDEIHQAEFSTLEERLEKIEAKLSL